MHEHLRAAFGEVGITDLRASQAPGDEARLVHEAIADGVQTLVVAGGDGTWGKSAVALAKAGSPARMAFVAAGTGNDFAKNLRAPAHDLRAMARLVAGGGTERRVDLGRVDDTWFANVAGFGFDVAVLHATRRMPAQREVMAYDGLEARLDGGDGVSPERWIRRLMVIFANGHVFGGTFPIAPGARVDDGMLDAIVFDESSRAGRVPLLLRALRGTHAAHPEVHRAAGSRFTLECREPPWYELDGDLHRAPSPQVEIAVVPGVLRVLDANPS